MKRKVHPYAPIIDLTVRFFGDEVWYRVGTWAAWSYLARERGCSTAMMLEQACQISFIQVCGRWFRFDRGGIRFAGDRPELSSASLANALDKSEAA